MFTAFLTGSTVYGDKPPNDVDLVVPCTPELKEKLIAESDNGCLPCMYGNLNLILVTTPEEYTAWLLSTRECRRVFVENGVPYTKERAIEIHTQQRTNCGVRPEGNSDSGQCPDCKWFGGRHDDECPKNPTNRTVPSHLDADRERGCVCDRPGVTHEWYCPLYSPLDEPDPTPTKPVPGVRQCNCTGLSHRNDCPLWQLPL